MASVGIDIGAVYESATKIGQEFQRIIEQHGQDVVENLLPLVVESLEKLEQVVEEISELHKENSRLSVEASRLQSETEARQRLSKENQNLKDLLTRRDAEMKDCKDEIKQMTARLNSQEIALKEAGLCNFM
jgi:cell shape-determining protein MreC